MSCFCPTPGSAACLCPLEPFECVCTCHQETLATHVHWRFALGQRVRWPGSHDAATVYHIAWRRYHEGETSHYIEYGMVREEETDQPRAYVWRAYEADLVAVEEDA